MFDIQPQNFIQIINKFDIDVCEIKLHEYVVVSVQFYDYDGKIIHSTQVKIDGNDYLNWSNDDNYIVSIVCQRLNLTLLN